MASEEGGGSRRGRSFIALELRNLGLICSKLVPNVMGHMAGQIRRRCDASDAHFGENKRQLRFISVGIVSCGFCNRWKQSVCPSESDASVSSQPPITKEETEPVAVQRGPIRSLEGGNSPGHFSLSFFCVDGDKDGIVGEGARRKDGAKVLRRGEDQTGSNALSLSVSPATY